MPGFFRSHRRGLLCSLLAITAAIAVAQPPSVPASVVLHAARLLQIESGKILQPGEILVEGDRIRAVGARR